MEAEDLFSLSFRTVRFITAISNSFTDLAILYSSFLTPPRFKTYLVMLPKMSMHFSKTRLALMYLSLESLLGLFDHQLAVEQEQLQLVVEDVAGLCSAVPTAVLSRFLQTSMNLCVKPSERLGMLKCRAMLAATRPACRK
jgi:hypothetical protein